MSSYYTKYQSHNESNIPIPKKTQTGIKKSKRCAQLPELQRYIETIIKASNECDSEDTSLSDREKFPKDRKFGKYSVFKGLSNKITQDKINDDFNLTRNKSYNKSKTPVTDVVSRDDKISNMYVREFEDPRNWKLDKTVCLGPKLEIEKFLKKFYPNPYKLENISEFKGEKDDLRDVTLPDVVISKCNTEVIVEKTDLGTADNEIKPCKRETKPLIPTSDTENHTKSQSCNGDVKLSTTSAPTLVKNPITHKMNHPASNSSSRVNSLESLHTVHHKESSVTLKSRKHQKSKTKIKTIEKTDYDIGKLKLLSATDSEEFINTTKKPQTNTTVNVLSNIEYDNMTEIYNIMDKATASILSIESKENKDVGKPLKVPDDKKLLNDDTAIQKNVSTLRKENTKKENNTTWKSLPNHGSDTSENEPQVDKPLDGENKPEEKSTEPESDPGSSQQKIDEVVDYIYDCLRKFGNKEKPEKLETPQEEDEKKQENAAEKETVSQPSQPGNKSRENLFETERLRQLETAQNKQIIENRRTRLKCKKKPGTLKPNILLEGNLEEMTSPPSSRQVNNTLETISLELRVESPHQNNENTCIATVESHNELGSYTEEQRTVEDSKFPKSNLPLPVKLKKVEFGTCKTLINALGGPEKNLGDSETQLEENLNLILENRTLVMTPSAATTFPKIGGFEQDGVICINSGPQYIRWMKYIRPTLTSSVAFTLDNSSSLEKQNQKNFSVMKHFVANESWCRVAKRVFYYRRESIVTAISNEIVIAYNMWPCCQKTIANVCRTREEPSKTSSNLIHILIKAQEPTPTPEKPMRIITQPSEIIKTESKPTNPTGTENKRINSVGTGSEPTDHVMCRPCADSNSKSTNTFGTDFKTTHSVSIDNKSTNSVGIDRVPTEPVDSGIQSTEILNKTTEIFPLENPLEKNTPSKPIATGTKDNSSQSEPDNENYRKKVHELLMRAHNLEQKLQKCLQIMSCLESNPPVNLSAQEGALSGIRNQQQNRLNIQPKSTALVHWHLKPSESDKNSKNRQEISKVDNGTTYDPPPREQNEQQKSEKKQPENVDEEDGAELSDSSFKSSNDVSQAGESPKSQNQKASKKRFIKNILTQIESYRQSAESKPDMQKDESKSKPQDNQLAQYDPKSQPKVLRTVFKGKRSSTELTIGLKDVPMTKVGNISVEKTKFSPNHTKISICISQNTPEKFPPYVFDQVRPSISSCLTDYSRLKDGMSKSSQSNDETDEENDEEDEDDYKSVASTLSHSEEEEEKSVPNTRKPADGTGVKNFTKHRFEFYRKMNLDLQSNKSKRNSVCRYKELEPLKQALTEMQIRMRSIKRDALFNSNEYYERALKLAKMSAGFCQSCGNRAVIPNDTFGYYRTLLPGKSTQNSKLHHFRTTITPNTPFCTFPATNGEIRHRSSDLGLTKTSCSFHPAVHQSNRTILRSSLRDMPIVFEGL